MTKKLTTFEAMCIITGYGLGSGIMLIPFYFAKNGIVVAALILVLAFVLSCVLHLMVGELSLNSGEDCQVVSIFSKFLLKGKFKKALTWGFFVIMALTLFANTAVYISGSALLISSLFPAINQFWSTLIFFAFSAFIVLIGLKAVGVSEKVSISVISATLLVLVVASFFKGNFAPLPTEFGNFVSGLNLFSKAMFVFVAFFSVPQVVKGLGKDAKKVRTAIVGGMSINLLFSFIIVIFTLAISPIPSGTTVIPDGYLAIVEWTKNLPVWTVYLGGVISLLAFVTTFWSISFALTDIVKEQLKIKNIFCWLIATIPSFLLAISLINSNGFKTLIDMAGGVISILIVFLLIPTYRGMLRDPESKERLLKYNAFPVQIAVVAGYLLMAIGSVI